MLFVAARIVSITIECPKSVAKEAKRLCCPLQAPGNPTAGRHVG